jgi:hypothetical protein
MIYFYLHLTHTWVEALQRSILREGDPKFPKIYEGKETTLKILPPPFLEWAKKVAIFFKI